MSKLPLTYKPKILRQPEPKPVREVAYSVGKLESISNQKFYQGPFDDINSALEIVPINYGDHVIVRHETDGTDTLVYAWNHANQCWYLMDHQED